MERVAIHHEQYSSKSLSCILYVAKELKFHYFSLQGKFSVWLHIVISRLIAVTILPCPEILNHSVVYTGSNAMICAEYIATKIEIEPLKQQWGAGQRCRNETVCGD